MKRKIYLANGLFSEADYNYNELLANQIDELGYDLYVPQRNTAINDKTKVASSIPIYQGDTDELLSSDIIVAVIDGPIIDPGVAAEIGVIAGINEIISSHTRKKILALYTDSRDGTHTPSGDPLNTKAQLLQGGIAESQFSYANLYVIGAIKKYGIVFSSRDELLAYLKKDNIEA